MILECVNKKYFLLICVGLCNTFLSSVYSPFSDEVELPLHNIPCCCLPTPMTLASPPASFSVHLASSAFTPVGSVHKSMATMWCVCAIEEMMCV